MADTYGAHHGQRAYRWGRHLFWADEYGIPWFISPVGRHRKRFLSRRRTVAAIRNRLVSHG